MSVLALYDASVSASSQNLIAGVSFEVRGGEMLGLLGPNGAGKTTAVRALLGLQPLSSGRATLDGQDIARISAGDRARKIAYLPQSRQLAWPIAVREAIALGRFAYGTSLGRLSQADQDAVKQAMITCDLDALEDRSVASLSGGELARVHLARALASGADTLIADEPTAALDPSHAFNVLDTLQAKAKTGGGVVVILHDLALAARYCDRIILMHQGQVCGDGLPRDVLTPANVAQVFGVRSEWREGQLLILGQA